LKREDLQSLGTSLKVLDLSGNCLTSVPEAIFWDLQRLESLDLSRNNIIQIHSMAFQNGVRIFKACCKNAQFEIISDRQGIPGCQMVYFQTKNPNLVFRRAFGMENVGIFMEY
jgi:Leucine-rich repeat (LRR) protein